MKNNYGKILIAGFLMWLLGLSMATSSARLSTIILTFSTMFYTVGFSAWIYFLNKEDDYNLSSIIARIVRKNSLFYYAAKINISIQAVLFLLVIPFTSFQIISDMTEGDNWNVELELFNESQELDELFGSSRIYSSPEWQILNDSIKFTRVYTEGTMATGTFTFTINKFSEEFKIEQIKESK